MNEHALKYTDHEDILDVIELAERSFGADLSHVHKEPITTIGDLAVLINQCTDGESATDCTTQQAFYRLRSSLATILVIKPNTIQPGTMLNDIIPAPNRRTLINRLDWALGVQTELLMPKQWQIKALVILLLLSLGSLIPAWPYSMAGLTLYGIGVWRVNRNANVLAVTTVGQLAQKISREHYRAIRRESSTVNRSELESLLFDLFSHELSIPRHQLTRDTLILH